MDYRFIVAMSIPTDDVRRESMYSREQRCVSSLTHRSTSNVKDIHI